MRSIRQVTSGCGFAAEQPRYCRDPTPSTGLSWQSSLPCACSGRERSACSFFISNDMHPLLRAYMAGITLPTMVIPFVIGLVSMDHSTVRPFHLEDVVFFPVGLVPAAWGLWNMLYTRVRRYRDVPIGLFGAALLVPLGAAGYAIQTALGKMLWTPDLLAIGVPIAIVVY